MNKEFKECSTCGYRWITRDEFIEDPKLVMVGYQVNFNRLEEAFFLFKHDCGASLGITAGEFKDLYHGPIFSERKANTEECPQYCLYIENMSCCPAKCECSYIREIMLILKDWPKRESIPSEG